jgi:hypothetical protein
MPDGRVGTGHCMVEDAWASGAILALTFRRDPGEHLWRVLGIKIDPLHTAIISMR